MRSCNKGLYFSSLVKQRRDRQLGLNFYLNAKNLPSSRYFLFCFSHPNIGERLAKRKHCLGRKKTKKTLGQGGGKQRTRYLRHDARCDVGEMSFLQRGRMDVQRERAKNEQRTRTRKFSRKNGSFQRTKENVSGRDAAPQAPVHLFFYSFHFFTVLLLFLHHSLLVYSYIHRFRLHLDLTYIGLHKAACCHRIFLSYFTSPL